MTPNLPPVLPEFTAPPFDGISRDKGDRFAWWSWNPFYPYWSKSCHQGATIDEAIAAAKTPNAIKLRHYHNKLIEERNGEMIEVIDIPHGTPLDSIARANGIVQCRRCGAEVKSGIAIGQTYVGHPDFPGDTGMEPGCTISPGGPGKVIQCQKCTECGHSFVPANGIVGESSGNSGEVESPKPDEGEEFSININWHPDVDYDPDWKTMKKSAFLEEWSYDEEDWQDMVKAGAIIHRRSTPEYHGGFMSPERWQQLESDLAAARWLNEAHEQSQASKDALVREIDGILFGENAAKQASLCDLVHPIRNLKQSEQRLRAALEWQPIETAPKDGTKILLYVVHPADDYAKTTGHPDGWNAVESGYWNAHPDRGWENETAGTPTHWMPLPTAPASSGKGEG